MSSIWNLNLVGSGTESYSSGVLEVELALSSFSSWSLISENMQDTKLFSFFLKTNETECYQISDTNKNALLIQVMYFL